jgi:hypothetical protein
MADVKVLEGKKISDAELKTLDRSKMGVMLAGPPRAQDVEGQMIVWTVTQCPWCGHFGYSAVDTTRFNWYTCGLCGQPFRA